MSVAEPLDTVSAGMYTISPAAISGASPDQNCDNIVVFIKCSIFSVNGSCAANVITPPLLEAVVTKTSWKKYLIFTSVPAEIC